MSIVPADCDLGRFVIVVNRRSRMRGATGLLIAVVDGGRRSVIRFGASGPDFTFSNRSLRWATRVDVNDAGLQGVNHNPIYA